MDTIKNLFTSCIIQKNSYNNGYCYKVSKFNNNKYFAIKKDIKDINEFTEFRPINDKYFTDYVINKADIDKYNIIELIITENDKFFVENYQAISGIQNPKYKIIDYDEFNNLTKTMTSKFINI